MSQFDFIKDIAKYSLNNDQDLLRKTLGDLIDYSLRTKKTNFALQLQSILKEAIRKQDLGGMSILGSPKRIQFEEDKEVQDLIIEKLTSDYKTTDIVCSSSVMEELNYFLIEQRSLHLLNGMDLPMANKVLFYGPSGCGKTLASYVLAGELKKMLIIINLGAIVSSKLGETSKNLAKLFRNASNEECIIFFDEFDSLGKIRDYDQDHGEMKRVVNTILQLFDFLPKNSVVIAATNQINMIDDALLRRFDLTLKLDLPNQEQIKELIDKILKGKDFSFDNKKRAETIMKKCEGLSYYIIQKTLLTSLKRSIFDLKVDIIPAKVKIKTSVWGQLIDHELSQLKKL
jgi:AAA+ superfamily predicted ATPase